MTDTKYVQWEGRSFKIYRGVLSMGHLEVYRRISYKGVVKDAAGNLPTFWKWDLLSRDQTVSLLERITAESLGLTSEIRLTFSESPPKD